MKKRTLVSLLPILILNFVYLAAAQQPTKVPRIGYVSGLGDTNNPGPQVEAFRQGLRDFGYIEGQNILVEYRYIEGNRNQISGLVTELVHLKVDVLISGTVPAILAAKQATKTIPIVMVTNMDPVATGLVDSFARPGWKYHGTHQTHQRLERKASRIAQGGGPRDVARRSPLGDRSRSCGDWPCWCERVRGRG